ncbi:DUF6244 family protein [Micromonospora sp. CPCC 205546]|uniref:DUF6244 family protein n=1 Tax=Micromonospora sp. CPCC 205546 TaxID=3122397 RepID=UPI002FF11C0D
MSLTDSISDDLRAMAAGVDTAQQQAAAAEHAVAQIAARAVAAGFTGVAVRLTQVRELVGHVRARLTTVGGVLDEAPRVATAIAQQPSPQDTVSALTRLAATVSTVDAAVVAAAAGVEQGRRLTAATLHGGQPGPTLAHLQRLGQSLTTIKARTGEARQHVEAALTQARHIGGLGTMTPSDGRGRPPVPDVTGSQGTASRGEQTPSQLADIPVPADPTWARVDPAAVPETVRPTIDHFEPRPAGSTRPTAGLLDGEPVTSGGGDRSLAADLQHDPLRGPPVTFYDHVESKAAAYMRRTGATEADLAIDNTVCGTNDRDRSYSWTCDRILPAILPPESRLRVWVTRDGGHTWWHRIYTGTGERITR